MKLTPLALSLVGVGMVACHTHTPEEVRAMAQMSGADDIVQTPLVDEERVNLGRMLFFDPLLSGNKDISCSTCHHPFEALGDGRSLPVGTAAIQGLVRMPGPDHRLVPRNAPGLFDAGSDNVGALFWDSRLQRLEDGFVMYDNGHSATQIPRTALPDGLDSLLSAQVLFPLADRDEMRGDAGEVDIFGEANELAAVADGDFQSLWEAVTQRVVGTPGYEPLLLAAYPQQPVDALTPSQMANALAGFITNAFATEASPLDHFLGGEDDALSADALHGAGLFYGEAQCSVCHSGPLLSDEGLYNIGVRPIGRGPTREVHVDTGAALRTHVGPGQAYFFKTPRLRQVAHTGPWMHNGAYLSLEDVIRHHLDPLTGLMDFDGAGLAPEVARQVHQNPEVWDDVARTLSDEIGELPALSDRQIDALVAFLEHLSSDLSRVESSIPERVPSRLPMVEP